MEPIKENSVINAYAYLDSFYWIKLREKTETQLNHFLDVNRDLLLQPQNVFNGTCSLRTLRGKIVYENPFSPLIGKITHIINTLFKKYDKEALDLHLADCANAAEAVEYAINSHLKCVNLNEFCDVHDEDLLPLLHFCPDMIALRLYGKFITSKCLEKIEQLNHLVLFTLRVSPFCHLNLSTFTQLDYINLYDIRLEYLIFPIHMPTLRYIQLGRCENLQNLLMPLEAPCLSGVEMLFLNRLTVMLFPRNAPELERISFYDCGCLVDLILPEQLPKLTYFNCSYLNSLQRLTFPADAPLLKTLDLVNASHLGSINLPKNAPSLSINIVNCTQLPKEELSTRPILKL